MAASIRFPCIANIFNQSSKYRLNCSIYRIASKLYYSKKSFEMEDNYIVPKGQNFREGSSELVDHFQHHRSIRPDRNHLKYREACGDAISSNNAVFRVLSNGSYSSCKSIILLTDNTSYLFNSGDDVAKHIMENGGKWSKLEHIFITHRSHKNIAGTLEFAFIAAEATNRRCKLHLHGPGSVDCLINTVTRTFARELSGIAERIPPEQLFMDHVMTSQSILLADSSRPQDEEAAACAYKLAFKGPKRKVDPQKLVKYCVKGGPWLKEVVEHGKTVEVNGKTISPEDILFSARYMDVVLVVDCPTPNHLPDLMQKREELSLRIDNKKFVDMVIHLTPDAIVQHADYQQWMAHFPQTTQHLMVSESTNDLSLKTSWEQQVLYHEIDKEIFPMIYPKPREDMDACIEPEEKAANILQLKPNSVYTVIGGRRGLDNSHTHQLTKASAFDNLVNKEAALEAIKSRESRTDHSMTRDYPIVTMLGTAATMTTKHRNTAAILVEVEKDQYVLLDCGYGAVNQLIRLHGPEKADEILRNLKAVFVSHGHIDHHGGVLSLMCTRKEAFKGMPIPKLYLIFPKKLAVWYEHLHMEFDGCLEGVRCIYSGFLIKNSLPAKQFQDADQFKYIQPLLPDEYRRINIEIGLQHINTFNVRHAYALTCYGIVLQHEDWKLVYTGDTLPCDEVVEAAKDADLLIHEATFGPMLAKDARIKTHSTTHQAMAIAEQARAKFTLLTHFSGRYSRFPDCSERLLSTTNVGIAFDNMILRPKDLPNTTLASLYGVLEALYPDQMETLSKLSEKIKLNRLKGLGTDPDVLVQTMNEYVLHNEKIRSKYRKRKCPDANLATSSSTINKEEVAHNDTGDTTKQVAGISVSEDTKQESKKELRTRPASPTLNVMEQV